MGLVESGRVPKPLSKLLNLSRKYSIWAYQWGLACCAIEMGAAFASPRYDVMRLGVIPFPASPRQADLVVIAGTVTDKLAPAVVRLYEQMPDPKYVISMGSCANCGGPYWDSYSVTKGVCNYSGNFFGHESALSRIIVVGRLYAVVNDKVGRNSA